MSLYRAQWFDPRNGTWKDVNGGQVQADPIGEIQLPDFPAHTDWGLRLTYAGSAPVPKHF